MAPAAQEQWYIMYAVPDVSEDVMKPQKFPNATFSFNKVPLPSRLFVESSVASPAGSVEYPYIAAADRSGHLLLCGYTSFGLTFYICDPLFRMTMGIFPHDGGFNCHYCVGLIRNHNRRLLMVADLNPCFFEEDVFFTLFCTVDLYSWVEKEPDCSKILDKQQWRGDGVLTHEGLLWWFDFSYCILACDPFHDKPVLHQIKFPHVQHELPFAPSTINGDILRCLKVSEGSLRYVQIHGHRHEPVVSMWTLSSNNPSEAQWKPTHEVRLAEIWNHETYKRTPLHGDVIPTVALVNPMKAHEVYFFLDKHIFSVNLQNSSVVQYEKFEDSGMPDLSSRLVHAWQFPPELTEYHHLPGTDVLGATGVYFLNQYDSVEDFHEEVIAATDRWCPELHEMGLEELEDGDDDASEMSVDLEGDGDDSETSGDDSEISEDDVEEDGDED
ncbi:hypothetical protein CFC21_016411 [Triticum aestivum]|uniref:DUF1618 domain-containing protein n=3 Tax=Triticum TaxID=4564 RepID=A0A3B6AX19_WHEAT|nr:uncharacterized protein LOC123188285 [Triticum aestivum]KAF7000519.1 hypothetical protein CFC21_016411 [Triticum aestivum]